MFYTPIARFATRPGSGEIKDFNKPEICNATPDLIMGTLLKNCAHILKSNTIYELVMNEMTDILELREVGKSWINEKWARKFYDITSDYGSEIWLSEDEYTEHKRQSN